MSSPSRPGETLYLISASTGLRSYRGRFEVVLASPLTGATSQQRHEEAHGRCWCRSTYGYYSRSFVVFEVLVTERLLLCVLVTSEVVGHFKATLRILLADPSCEMHG